MNPRMLVEFVDGSKTAVEMAAKLAAGTTVAVLFGAAQCGKRPSPAMISAFLESFNEHIGTHGSLLPIVRAFSDEDRYPRLGEIAVPTVVMIGSADRTTPPM